MTCRNRHNLTAVLFAPVFGNHASRPNLIRLTGLRRAFIDRRQRVQSSSRTAFADVSCHGQGLTSDICTLSQKQAHYRPQQLALRGRRCASPPIHLVAVILARCNMSQGQPEFLNCCGFSCRCRDWSPSGSVAYSRHPVRDPRIACHRRVRSPERQADVQRQLPDRVTATALRRFRNCARPFDSPGESL